MARNAHIAAALLCLSINSHPVFGRVVFLSTSDVRTVQVGSFLFLILLMLEFVAFFIWRGDYTGFHSVPVFGDTYPQLVSVFIFSWAYVIFVPSWLNEKAVETSVNKVIWSSGIASSDHPMSLPAALSHTQSFPVRHQMFNPIAN